MIENIPPSDELYDEIGRVKDVDAAEEMASHEDLLREHDKERFFKPKKKELQERELILNRIGREVLDEKKRYMEIDRESAQNEESRQKLYEEFIERNLSKNNITKSQWKAFSPQERDRLEQAWKRIEEQTPAFYLEKKLETLLGKKVSSFEVSDSADVILKFEDGTTLSFTSLDGWGDPYYQGIEISEPKLQEEV
jgi:hypothetical protein